LTVPLDAFDPDGDPLAVWADNLPPGATFDPLSSSLVWTPGYEASGIYRAVRFSASDGISVVSTVFDITIADAPRPPELLPLLPRSIVEGQTLVVTLRTPGGSSIAGYGMVSPPLGAAFDTARGILVWTPA